MLDIKEIESKTTNINRFILAERIGKGNFGQVYKVQEKSTKKFYAAKILQINDTSEETMRNIAVEVNNHAKFKHPSIVEFIGFSKTSFKNEKKPVFITEYVPLGTLTDWINNERNGNSNKDWNQTRKLIIIYGIASAMAYLHKNNFIHRDLKPDNILMDENLLPKIADFGLSKFTSDNNDTLKSTTIGGAKGTPLYMAPEVFNDAFYSEAGDVYAFGIILFELITLKKPFEKHLEFVTRYHR